MLVRPLRRLALAVALLATLAASQSLAQTVDPLPMPDGDVLLDVTGAIGVADAPARFDRPMLDAFAHRSLTTHTAVTDGPHRFEGVLVRDVLDRVGLEGGTVTAIALNDYRIEIPAADFYDYDVILATHMDGTELTARDKGPLWIVYPRDAHDVLQDIRYDYRWVWQLVRLHVE